MIAKLAWVGRAVECPHCASALRVPPPPDDDQQPVRAMPAVLGAQQRFNFPCRQCDSLLEGHTGMCGQAARCPTCGAGLMVPYLDARGMPLGASARDGAQPPQDPVPVHAYGASGGAAPRIVRRPDGSQVIECPSCSAHCAVDADNCRACGAPFTMEGAPTMSGLSYDARALAALFLGIVALPTFFVFLPGALAVVLGLASLQHALRGNRRPTVAIVAIVLGIISLTGGVLNYAL
ncbi:MAG: hypothetical protein KKB50_12585 [Planctomycetes bacterium]|nr:hypothetical protein [Planctomycetota bacterium]